MIRTKLRTQQVIIDMPKEGEDIWLHVTLQKVDKDTETGKIINTSPRNNEIHKTVSKYQADLFTFFDPVQQKEITISGAGMHMAFAEAILGWTAEDFNGTREGLEVWID